MTNKRTTQVSDPSFFHMRQALVEAKLITNKHAADAVYVVTLAEELRNIEAKIAALEEHRSLGSSPNSGKIDTVPCPEYLPDALWIQSTACQLEARLRRMQSPSEHTDHTAPGLENRTHRP